jgi:hypothetical protein
VARRPRLDQHRPLKANETVGDLTVVMPWYALSGRKAQHLDAQIGALGDQFAAGDRIITAIAPLHRSRSFLCPMTHFADPKGLGHDFGPSRRPEQQDIAGKRQARIHDGSGASDDRNRGDTRFESSLFQRGVWREPDFLSLRRVGGKLKSLPVLESYHRCAPQHPSAGARFCCTQSCSYGEPSLMRSDRLVNG